MHEFQVRKHDFTVSRILSPRKNPSSRLENGEIVVKIDCFAYSANNITYAVLGDKLGYWQFFHPSEQTANDWGIIPVWGFADVVESASNDVQVGERLFGYFPPATALKMGSVRVSGQRLLDGASHRAALPSGYNNYAIVSREPQYNKSMDAARMLLWPLHLTSYCLWDLLQDNQWYGAEQIIILSASSKTSVGLAIALQADASAPEVIGLTSQRNHNFVQQLGLYSTTYNYSQLDSVRSNVPTVIVDMSGDRSILAQLNSRLGDNMIRCINVGLTHWNQTNDLPEAVGMNTSRSEFFFAPRHIQRRIKEWGADVFAEKTSSFLQKSAQQSLQTIQFTELAGLEALQTAHQTVCNGSSPPEQGIIVRMP